MRATLLALGIGLLLSACAAGPDYKRPKLDSPAQFKENKGWVQAAPLAVPAQGAWWTIFGDETLNTLEPRVASANRVCVLPISLISKPWRSPMLPVPPNIPRWVRRFLPRVHPLGDREARRTRYVRQNSGLHRQLGAGFLGQGAPSGGGQ